MSMSALLVLALVYAGVAWMVVTDPSRSIDLPTAATNVLSLCVITLAGVPLVLLYFIWVSAVAAVPGDAKAYAIMYVPWALVACSILIVASVAPKARLYGRRLVVLVWTVFGTSLALTLYAVAYHARLR
jgi:hypothetical protein